MKTTYAIRTEAARCSECRCQLPINDRGYCQRCEEGWYDFIDIANASKEKLAYELGLARYYQETLDGKGMVDRRLDTYIADLIVALRE